MFLQKHCEEKQLLKNNLFSYNFSPNQKPNTHAVKHPSSHSTARQPYNNLSAVRGYRPAALLSRSPDETGNGCPMCCFYSLETAGEAAARSPALRPRARSAAFRFSVCCFQGLDGLRQVWKGMWAAGSKSCDPLTAAG